MVGPKQQASTGSGSSTNSRHGRVKCGCGVSAIVRVAKKGPNCGMQFLGCSSWPEYNCGFFRWVPENNAIEDLQFQVLEKDTTISELEYDKKLLEEKLKKVQLKKDNLEEDIHEMKNEVCELRIEVMRAIRNEKNYSMALMYSCLLFAFVLFYLK
ncbi:uncharacterized protein [Spinacia oleracea]|uniref:GRF-type domain-containing protein n=1 Tax=Spinacia oleracea TaxID=3562 RepID=A0ABM3QNF5_SPIOL|nr:uncharacterized protein LOC130461030 [Spinacia oleracea]